MTDREFRKAMFQLCLKAIRAAAQKDVETIGEGVAMFMFYPGGAPTGELALLGSPDQARRLLASVDAYGVIIVAESWMWLDEEKEGPKESVILITWEFQKTAGGGIAVINGEGEGRTLGPWQDGPTTSGPNGGRLAQLLPGARGN